MTALACAGFLFVIDQYQAPNLPPEGIEGTAYFKISSLSLNSTSFGKRWIYKGVIELFSNSNNLKIKNVACTITIPLEKDAQRPPANRAYLIVGTLKKNSSNHYYLKADRSKAWFPVKNSWSLSELRFHAKKFLKKHLHQRIKTKDAADFLTGILIGEFENKLMSFEFTRFGLQHIMAISGFHFAILALILNTFLRLIFNRKTATLILIMLLTSYYLFLGSSASIERAWIGAMVFLSADLLRRQSDSLNTLGIALILLLVFEPLASQSIGFRFSFLVTAGILFFFSITDFFLSKFFIKRSFADTLLMSPLDQHAYIILTYFRQALALTIAVNLVALPMSLCTFEKFQLLSLVYNLFFPFMVSFSMFLLIIGLTLGLLISPLGNLFHTFNNTFTKFVLDFTSNLPQSFDLVIYSDRLSTSFLTSYLSLLFVLGILLKEWLKNQQEESQDFTFL
jgi:competence protein ComEC